MNVRLTIVVAFFVVLLAAAVWDVIAQNSPVPSETVSAIILAWCREYPALALLTGFVLGHLFWPQNVVIVR